MTELRKHIRRYLMRYLIPAGFLALLSAGASAQYVKQYNPWPVISGTDTLDLPFWGGINSPKSDLVDFDGDGLFDLFIASAQEGAERVSYLKNTGTAEKPAWTPVTERFGEINTGKWFRFADIDADGDLDLFCDSRTGFASFYRNESVGADLRFVLVKEVYGGFQTGFNNTPEFADIDGDGDLDFFFGNLAGGLDLYRNIGTPTTAVFILETSAYDDVLAFPGACGFSSPVTPDGQPGGVQMSNRTQLHGFSAISFADVNSDGALDLFYGDIFNHNLYFFLNFGTFDFSDLICQTENFLPFTTRGLNHIALADLDNDADPDMLVGAANGDDIDNLIFLRNVGAPDNHIFVRESKNLLENIDIGTASVPTFGDIDGDGDQDLFIGGQNGRLALYRNTGTAVAPVFNLESSFFDSIAVGAALAPELVDWDTDGDLDLLVSATANLGRIVSIIQLRRNVGSRTNFNLSSTPETIVATDGIIQVDSDAIPRAVDMNGDGKLDLLVGEFDFNGRANVRLYGNIGTSGNPVLQQVSGGLLRREDFIFFQLAQPIDWDGDGRQDLVVGNLQSGLKLFRNLAPPGQFPDSLTLLEMPALLPGSNDGARLVPAFVDIDNDGDLDAFIGENDGGINFYRHTGQGVTRGDVDGFPGIGEADVVYLINYMLLDGPPPLPSTLSADVDCSGSIDLVDVISLLTYVFASGPAPCAN